MTVAGVDAAAVPIRFYLFQSLLQKVTVILIAYEASFCGNDVELLLNGSKQRGRGCQSDSDESARSEILYFVRVIFL